MRRIFRPATTIMTLFIVLPLLSCAGISGAPSKTEIETPPGETFILVHGAWHGAWAWDRVVPLLEAAGHKAIAIDLPAHGDDQAAIVDQNVETNGLAVAKALARQNRPVILVGHSLGGVSITQGSEYRADKVKKLVYLTAYLPTKDWNTKKPADWAKLEKMGIVKLIHGGKCTMVANEKWAKETFYNGCTPEDADWAYRKLEPEAIAAAVYNGNPIHITARFDSIPRYYIKCMKDKAIKPEFQKKMIDASVVEKVYEIFTGHSPFLVDPEGLVEIFLDIVKQQP